MRVHILGTGAIGCQVAVGLRARNNVTLILRSQQALQDFRSRQNVITYNRVDKEEPVHSSGFDAVVAGEDTFSENPLKAVVVATKSQHTVNAIGSIKSHLSSSSTIVLLQNGMGVAEELLRTFWPGNARIEAPSIIVGVNRHAVRREEPFSILHASGWTNPEEGVHLGVMPGSLPEQTQPVIQAFTNSAELNATAVDWPELQIRMMRKLVVNGSINAVAALLECTNGSLIDNKHGLILLRGVCDEAAQIRMSDDC
ncbi:ketopantoate reductase PanE/ApbA-domain-containing protein [Fennellomyces sp. T-0311]|nr:ketopantoate reductase PanE/ApbA-domain-containing protein [Fennellomyces sp. T-0311]